LTVSVDTLGSIRKNPFALDKIENKFRFGSYFIRVYKFHLAALDPLSRTTLSRQDGYEYHFVVRGRGSLNLQGRTYPLKPGMTYLTSPATEFRIETGPQEPLEEFRLHVRIERIDGEPQDRFELEKWGDMYEGIDARECMQFLQEPPAQPAVDKFHASSWFVTAFEEWQQRDFALYTSLKLATLQIMIRTVRNFSKPSERHPFPYRDMNAHRLEMAIRFIHANYSRPITVGEVADSMSIGIRQLQRAWREAKGGKLSEYLERYRLEQVCAELEHSARTIGEIAERCGFASVSYLHSVFKKRLGLTPSQYRTSLAEADGCEGDGQIWGLGSEIGRIMPE